MAYIHLSSLQLTLYNCYSGGLYYVIFCVCSQPRGHATVARTWIGHVKMTRGALPPFFSQTTATPNFSHCCSISGSPDPLSSVYELQAQDCAVETCPGGPGKSSAIGVGPRKVGMGADLIGQEIDWLDSMMSRINF